MPSYSLRTLLLTALATSIGGLLPQVSFAAAQDTPAATTTTATSPALADKKLAEMLERFQRCAAVQEIGIRMSCYDDYAVELGYITPERAKAAVEKFENIGAWQITRIDDGHGLVQTQLRTDSLNKLATSKTFERQVSISIRCVPGRTEAMIDWKANVLAGHSSNIKKMLVNYQSESGAKVAEEWDTSTDRKALFAPDAIAFSRYLMNKKSLQFSFGSMNISTANVARFNISGIETALNEIVKDCYSGASKTP